MKRRRTYVLVQLLLIGLCFVALLFSMFRERVIVQHVIQRYELPYLGTTLLRTIDGPTGDDLALELRTFEDSSRVRVYVFDPDGFLVYPETVSEAVSQRIMTARVKILDKGYGPLYEPSGHSVPLLWGILDRKSGNTVIMTFSRMRLLDMYRQESRRLTAIFFTLFVLLAVGAFLIVRYVFRAMERELQWNRERFTRLQAVAEAQFSLVKKAQSLMNRCGTALREGNSPDPVAEDLCGYSSFLGKTGTALIPVRDPDGNAVSPEPVHLHTLCTQVQTLVADDFSAAGIVLSLGEHDADLYVRGQESLLLVALEDLLYKLLPAIGRDAKAGMTISGNKELAVLKINVPVKEHAACPPGFFLSGFLFELLGVEISYMIKDHMELIITVQFQGSGV